MKAKKQDMNLNVELSVEGRTSQNRWTFTRSNTHVTRSDKVNSTQFVFALLICLILINCAFQIVQHIIETLNVSVFSRQVKLTQKFNITAHGNGMATLSVRTRERSQFNDMLFKIQP